MSEPTGAPPSYEAYWAATGLPVCKGERITIVATKGNRTALFAYTQGERVVCHSEGGTGLESHHSTVIDGVELRQRERR